MASDANVENPAEENSGKHGALEGGSYEVLHRRLLEEGARLAKKVDALNKKRKETFGGTELTVLGNERVRTENNCVPRDIVNIGGTLLFGYNVYIGLKTETRVADVFSLHSFRAHEDGSFVIKDAPEDSVAGLLADSGFQKDFKELYRYYKDSKLIQVRRTEGRLLLVFQIGRAITDIKAFRFAVDVNDQVKYLDNRGDEDHIFPPSHDFEWTPTTREDHVSGRHPHVSILDECFVETVGGDLTIKIENNTEDGQGIYREPVEDPRQSLDDGEFHYAKVGGLILLKVLPYQEETWRYLVFNTRTKKATRIDAIGQACVQLPEDHGIVFPGGYFLQDGDTKLFGGDTREFQFKQSIRSPNGEDVLYVFYHQNDGRYLLLPYNLIRKEVQNPIACHGFTLFEDGNMLVFRSASDEPTRVHPMQIWQTPFVSDEHAAEVPTDNSYLGKVGNRDLVRGISDAYGMRRLIETKTPSRQSYEDLLAATVRARDAYYWLDNDEVENLGETIDLIRKNGELILDEFEKVEALKRKAQEALTEAKEDKERLLQDSRPEDWRSVTDFLGAMTSLRQHRGHLITLREVRYIDIEAIDALEAEVVKEFDQVSKHCVDFLLTGEAFGPLLGEISQLLERIEKVDKASEAENFDQELSRLTDGLNLLSEVVSGLNVEDTTHRTQILESISEVFGQLNRVRATLVSKKKELSKREGTAEFGAQFKLLAQAVSSAVAMADSPEKCDEELSRLMVQLEELEGRFGEFDEFLLELAQKREEIYEALESKKQQLVDDRQRRAQNMITAGGRILEGVARRTRAFKEEDELNAYFASDAMVLKLRQLAERLLELGDSVKADDLLSQLKSAKQNALRNLRDKLDLFEDGDQVIKLGKHRFNINTQAFELTMVPRDDEMALHLTGTDFYESITDEDFRSTKTYWNRPLVSESDQVYRGEFLAASILFDAEKRRENLNIEALHEASQSTEALLGLIRSYAEKRYDEGYERGLHDLDTAKILEKLLSVRKAAGLLRFAPVPRALAALFWVYFEDQQTRDVFHRRAMSFARLRTAFGQSPEETALAQDLSQALAQFFEKERIETNHNELHIAGQYLVEELAAPQPRFTTSKEAVRVARELLAELERRGTRPLFEADLKAMEGALFARLQTARAWVTTFIGTLAEEEQRTASAVVLEAAVFLLTENKLDREESAALTELEVQGLLGQHRRIQDRRLTVRLDEFLVRLHDFINTDVPGFIAYRKARHELLDKERHQLRIDEFKPRVLSSFVRNRLINDVYLPLLGDNLAKQLGASGKTKRTDLMGMLLLISPPGYGKTTLMEYMASRLGMVFMKVNGPSLGHSVISLDPDEAPNATSRQEVEKINLALEMGNNVMLYLDDIQHTNPELLQKFISLCDAQRRIEGVWNGRTRTYDLRGKKFCVVMAGNPYTESGDKFQIPDMLANRADVYNLGDILDGQDHLFALSYIENCLTSNPALAPMATRSLDDVHVLIRIAKGEDVPETEFSHNYSRLEIEESIKVIKRLFVAQETLLKVNAEYIRSASMDDAFRTEPPFKLQGSYRNMNKLAEKIVAVMNENELDALIRDHYLGEAQTLTTGAEHNLLKLGELRQSLSEEEDTRWTSIKKDFKRLKLSGGKDDDPVTRVTSTLSGLGEHLDGIRTQLASAVDQRGSEGEDQPWISSHLARLDEAVSALAQPQLKVELEHKTPQEIQKVLKSQTDRFENTLAPLLRASLANIEEIRSMGKPLKDLIEILKLNALDPTRNNRFQGALFSPPPEATETEHPTRPVPPAGPPSVKEPASRRPKPRPDEDPIEARPVSKPLKPPAVPPRPRNKPKT